jgi:hypothetical protein
MNDKSKGSQVLDVLKKYVPKDKVILAMFDELMIIMRKGGTNRERRKKSIVKREEKAIVNVKVAAEAQTAVENAVIAVEIAVIAADEAESAEAAATQKVAEEAIIECEECKALSVVKTATTKVCDDCLWVTATVVAKAAHEKTASIAAETVVIAADEAVIAAERAAEKIEAEKAAEFFRVLKMLQEERRLKQEPHFLEVFSEIAAEATKEEREERERKWRNFVGCWGPACWAGPGRYGKKVCAQCEGTEWGLLGGLVVCYRCHTHACGYCQFQGGEPQSSTCVEARKLLRKW